MSTTVAVIAALLVSLAAPLVFAPLLQRIGATDVPNARSSHTRPAIRGMGLAPLAGIVAGFAILLFTDDNRSDPVRLVVILGITVGAAWLGLTEDMRGVPVAVRAGTQLLIGIVGAGLVVALAGWPWWLIPLYAIAIAAYVNVANFMDGINGISGLHGTIVGTAYGIAGAIIDIPWLVGAGLILAVAFVAFLPWNLLSGGMFLGDVGSYLLGGGIAIIAVTAVAYGVPVLAVLGPLVIYLADVGITLVRRIASGDRWLEAHRSHFYQRLTDSGLSHAQAASLASIATVLCAALGVLTIVEVDLVTVCAIAGIGIVIVAYLCAPRVLLRTRQSTAKEHT